MLDPVTLPEAEGETGGVAGVVPRIAPDTPAVAIVSN
jgi:hypothetical protein